MSSTHAFELLDFAEREFGSDWARYVREAMYSSARGDTSRKLYKFVERQKIVAMAHTDGARFGPIGVAQDHRGKGFGRQLALAVLAAQQRDGHKTSWFMWTDPATAKGFYESLGFREVRRFTIFEKSLSG